MNSLSIRNVLSAQKTPTPGRFAAESNRYPGHQQRMAAHMRMVRNHPCPCGSGERFRNCCLGKHQCPKCQMVFLIPDEGPANCPFCGTPKTVALPLQETWMSTCEACGREFKASNEERTCRFCGYDNQPSSTQPRSPASLQRLDEDRRRQEEEREEQEKTLDQE